MRLRRYQHDAVIAACRELSARQSTLVVHCTGSGKTVEMAMLSEVHLRQGGRRVLWTAPREELLDQAKKSILRWVPRLREIDVALEKAEHRAAAGTPIVLASPQSLHGDRLAQFRRDEFSLLLVDEAHIGGPVTQGIFEHFSAAKRVGYTATPDRLDGRPLIGDGGYESVAHVYELPDAIRDGYLVPLKFRRAAVLDLALPDPTGADFTDEQLEFAMQGEQVWSIARAICSVAKLKERDRTGMKSLVFLPTVKVAEEVAAAVNVLADTGGWQWQAAKATSGADRDRAEVVADFRAGKFPVLTSCMLFTYGFDVPDLSAVFLARPTKSRSLNSQMVGRVTRRFPGKEFGLVVDLVGNVGRHSLVTPEDALLLGVIPGYEPPLHPRRYGEEGTVDEEAAGAFAWDVLKEIESETAAEAARRATVSVSEIDPELAMFGIAVPTRDRNDRNATPAQREALSNAGIHNAHLLSFDQAQAIFEELAERRAAGICTLRMGRVLARKGLHPNAPFDDAEAGIEAIRKHNWRVPPGLLRRYPSLRYGGDVPLRVRGGA